MEKTAQELIEDLFSKLDSEVVLDTPEGEIVVEPESEIVSLDSLPDLLHELHESQSDHEHKHEHHEESHEHSPDDEVTFDIVLSELPGVDGPVEDIVLDEESSDEDSEKDVSKAEGPKDKWDWEALGPDKFLDWVKERFSAVPKHSGYDTSGLERAMSYLSKLDKEISNAMRLDLDGDLPHMLVEQIREEIEEALERLEDRLDKVKSKKKKASLSTDIVKTAATPVISGVVITVPLLISRLCRVAINGHVSAGHDLADTYVKLAKKYKLDDREKAEFMQLLSDMGYPLRQDRGVFDDDLDASSSDNFDFAANYQS